MPGIQEFNLNQATLERSFDGDFAAVKDVSFEAQSETRAWDMCAGLRVAAATPLVVPGDVESNTAAVCSLLAEAEEQQVDVIVFPELVLCGATCGDLLFQRALKDTVLKGLVRILLESEDVEMLICLSLPLQFDGHLLKVTAYLFQGEIVGMYPAESLSSAERRWFTPASEIRNLYDQSYELLIDDPAFHKDVPAQERESAWWQMINKKGSRCPLVTRDLNGILNEMAEPETSENEEDISFSCDLSPLDFIPEHILRYSFNFLKSSDVVSGLSVFAEIPAAFEPFAAGDMRYLSDAGHSLPGRGDVSEPLYELGQATVPLLAISDARPEYPLHYRQLRSALLERSAREEAVIVYAAAGARESSSQHVYAGHRLICANGNLLAEGEAFETGLTVAELDLEKIFAPNVVDEPLVTLAQPEDVLEVREFPFLPPERKQWQEFCYQVLDLQARGLAARLDHLDARAVLGLSGGLDSTLALLVCLRACGLLERPASDILAVSMPGPGSSPRSVAISEALAESSACDLMTIDIGEAVELHLRDIGHDGSLDNTYENAQARERTQILMDLANMKRGIVVGTGDLSELALGFCTYNGDQMSMYSVNHSVPKTLARIMLDIFAEDLLTTRPHSAYLSDFFYLNESKQKPMANLLREIISRPVSPELLPPEESGEISQKTEQIIGPYEHNDFFLFYLIYDGRPPKEVYEMACKVFTNTDPDELKNELIRFVKRFVRSQFKRQPMPEGAQVLPYSLSPHSAFQMPGDLSENSILEALKDL